MTDIVAQARAALEGITPGPWRHCRGSIDEPAIVVDHDYSTGEGYRVAVDDTMEDWADPGDIRAWVRIAAFIAQSPGLVAELADEVERLRGVCDERDRLAATVERLADASQSGDPS